MRRWLLCLLVAGCGGPKPTGDPLCTGTAAKCDVPSDQGDAAVAARLCAASRAQALDSGQNNRPAYEDGAIRWSCADVQGVNTSGEDSLGQEYCESFALVDLPGDLAPRVIGHGASGELTLVADDRRALQGLSLSDPDAEVGSCIFTSWQTDVPGPAPACLGDGSCADLPSYLQATAPREGLNPELYRMQRASNSSAAARDLLVDCMDPVARAGDPPVPIRDSQGHTRSIADPHVASDYLRGCGVVTTLYHTEYRKSDPTLCAAALRLGECGCGLTTSDAQDPESRAQTLAQALVPKPPAESKDVAFRGFPLASWTGLSALPQGCRYLSGTEGSGGASRTTVACRLTALQVLEGAKDLKSACRELYGENVVVYVPIPAELLRCAPPGGARCSATPWVVTN
jgi:hypothetical protein